MIIQRKHVTERIERGLRRNRGVILLGPRQCGKTTLARRIAASRNATYFDLEDPEHEARLAHPSLAIERLTGLVIIDEAQRMPSLFPVLRVLMDRENTPAKFLLLGSASSSLIHGAADSLAGRVEYVDMGGFQLDELDATAWRRLWFKGGFPRAYLASSMADTRAWLRGYVRSLAERDLRLMGIDLVPRNIERFLSMVGHYHGQTWNSSQVAAAMQLAHTTTRRYLDLLTGAFLVRQLPPWFENVGKRQVKSPKIYLRDSGLAHYLLGMRSFDELEGHPRLGASWEGFALEQILARTEGTDAYFWATHSGAELDLLLVRGGRRLGIEFKYTDAPGTTKAMHAAVATLRLDRVLVVSPVRSAFPLDKSMHAVPLAEALEEVNRFENGRPT